MKPSLHAVPESCRALETRGLGVGAATGLIAEHAAGAHVDRIGAPKLAMLAESFLLGEAVSDEAIRAEIAPCFLDDAEGRTDSIVLGCTHYPFLLERMRALAPWDVAYIDPAPAIARQAARLWQEDGHGESVAYVTDAPSLTRYRDVFRRFGFTRSNVL